MKCIALNLFLFSTCETASQTCEVVCAEARNNCVAACNGDTTCLRGCATGYDSCLQSHMEYWQTEPWHFGGINQGHWHGDGFDLKGCVTQADTVADYSASIDTSQLGQEMVGFGGAMTHSSAYLIFNHAERETIMTKLFGPAETGGAGISMIRVPLAPGSSFMPADPYIYINENDDTLESFTIEPDREYMLPILQQALDINPSLKFLATAWTAPSFMKDKNRLFGGDFLDQYTDTYSSYLSMIVAAYRDEGIVFDYMTTQNEPKHTANGYPSMGMTSDQQKALVIALKPKLIAAGLSTEIILYDHNWEDLEYARNILSDTDAYDAVDGTGFHCYGGNFWDPANLTVEFPEKSIYFTECTGHSGNNIWGPNTLKWHQGNNFLKF